MNRLKYTVKTFLTEENYNSLTTILEGLDISEEEYLSNLIEKDIKKQEQRYIESCK